MRLGGRGNRQYLTRTTVVACAGFFVVAAPVSAATRYAVPAWGLTAGTCASGSDLSTSAVHTSATGATALRITGASTYVSGTDNRNSAPAFVGARPVGTLNPGSAARRKWSRRRLWGNGHGRFRTRGRHGTATVRGTDC